MSDGSTAQVVQQWVDGGQAGIDALASAVAAVSSDGVGRALIPRYVPPTVQRRLATAMQVPLSGPAVPVAGSVICPTSGSTRTPRAVVQPLTTLRQAAADRDEALGGVGAWLIAAAPVSAAALIAVVRATRGPVPPQAWRGVGGRFDIDSFVVDAGQLQQRARYEDVPARVTMVSAQLAALLAQPNGKAALQGFQTVLVGGGPLAPELRVAAHSAEINVVTTYGLTESCGGCVYGGRVVAGTEVCIEDGEILLRGRTLAAGYLDAAFDLREGWFATGDRGHWDDLSLIHI